MKTNQKETWYFGTGPSDKINCFSKLIGLNSRLFYALRGHFVMSRNGVDCHETSFSRVEGSIEVEMVFEASSKTEVA